MEPPKSAPYIFLNTINDHQKNDALFGDVRAREDWHSVLGDSHLVDSWIAWKKGTSNFWWFIIIFPLEFAI